MTGSGKPDIDNLVEALSSNHMADLYSQSALLRIRSTSPGPVSRSDGRLVPSTLGQVDVVGSANSIRLMKLDVDGLDDEARQSWPVLDPPESSVVPLTCNRRASWTVFLRTALAVLQSAQNCECSLSRLPSFTVVLRNLLMH